MLSVVGRSTLSWTNSATAITPPSRANPSPRLPPSAQHLGAGSTGEDARHVHDSIGRCTQAYRDELAQDRHVVRVEHAEADSETEPRTHGRIHAVPEAQQHQSRDHQSQADGTRVDTPAEVALDPPVGERAADHHTEERREGNRKGRYRSGRGHRHPEAVGEERRQPVLGGPSGQRRRSEVKEHDPEGDVREQQPETTPHREVRLGACSLGLRLPGPAVLMQEEDQHDGIGDADDAEPVRSPARKTSRRP